MASGVARRPGLRAARDFYDYDMDILIGAVGSVM
jgi:hypothetical protein